MDLKIASHCVCCGKQLTDPESIERGMGPECSKEGYQMPDDIRQEVNLLTHAAAVACMEGDIQTVLDKAKSVEQKFGLIELANRMRHRFVNIQRNAKIVIKMLPSGEMAVKTPFRRSEKQAFIDAWRQIPNRCFIRGIGNVIPVESKPALWGLLKRFFPGAYGKGPKGLFRVPVPEEVKNEN